MGALDSYTYSSYQYLRECVENSREKMHTDVRIHRIKFWSNREFGLGTPVYLTLSRIDWPGQNFSLQYPYNFKQTGDENNKKYQLGNYQLIQWQIITTKIIRIVQQPVRRIWSEMGKASLKEFYPPPPPSSSHILEQTLTLICCGYQEIISLCNWIIIWNIN